MGRNKNLRAGNICPTEYYTEGFCEISSRSHFQMIQLRHCFLNWVLGKLKLLKIVCKLSTIHLSRKSSNVLKHLKMKLGLVFVSEREVYTWNKMSHELIIAEAEWGVHEGLTIPFSLLLYQFKTTYTHLCIRYFIHIHFLSSFSIKREVV